MENTFGENSEQWVVGRAGILYRDLTPNEFKSHVVASHIRLPFEGEVPDYVHYHKIDFQMIYCLKGRIKVVYEDQGPPFLLEPGDCVLQPPEIRHRVLECEANSEVIEITVPAEHETCAESDITLPTKELNPEREFNGQRFFLTSRRVAIPTFPNELVCEEFVKRMAMASTPDGIRAIVTDASRSLCRM